MGKKRERIYEIVQRIVCIALYSVELNYDIKGKEIFSIIDNRYYKCYNCSNMRKIFYLLLVLLLFVFNPLQINTIIPSSIALEGLIIGEDAPSGSAKENALTHWDNIRSIRVYIPKHKYTALMKKAFSEWEDVSKGRIYFRYVDSPKLAQDIVIFDDSNDPDGGYTGSTISKIQTICAPVYKRVDGHIEKICDEKNTVKRLKLKTITIKTKKLNEKIIYTDMLHEIGHSLGLPHTLSRDALMSPTSYDVKNITEADKKALYEIYGWK